MPSLARSGSLTVSASTRRTGRGRVGDRYQGKALRPVVERFEERILMSIGIAFEGPGDTGYLPPDPIVAAGPSSLVVMVNSQIAIYDKIGTQLDLADFDDGLGNTANFFRSVTRGFPTFDPWLTYDRYSDRYIVMAEEVELGSNGLGGFGANEANFLIAVSRTNNPDDLDVDPGDSDQDWYFYTTPATANFGNGLAWVDYPKIAADADSIYITGNYFTFGFASFGGVRVVKLDKIPMLSGTLGTRVNRTAAGAFTLQPAQSVGQAATADQFFIEEIASGLRVWRMNDAGTLSVVSTLSAPHNPLFQAAPQLGTFAQLDTISPRLMNAVYRDGSIWTTHTVESGGKGAVRWYEVNTVGGFSIVQQGTIDPGPGEWAFMPAINVNGDGDMAITYTQSSNNRFPAMMIAGRTDADPLGTTRPGMLAKASPSNYQALPQYVQRWGDYAGIAVDPTDDATFWAFGEYAANPTNWGTWFASVTIGGASPVVPNISINDVTVTESDSGTAGAVFHVSLSQPTTVGVSVMVNTADDTAFAPDDYASVFGTMLTFAPGETQKSFEVPIVGDTFFEGTESFFVELSGAVGGVITDDQGVGTINDNDNPPTLSINDVVKVEGNSGTRQFTFTVTLSAASASTVTVDYVSANGTAVFPNDYAPVSGTLTFVPGQVTQTITVLVNGNTAPEIDDTFFINLSNPTDALILDGTGLGTILNDDTSITVSDRSLNEGDGGTTAFEFNIRISVAVAFPVTVQYEANGGTASSPSDYAQIPLTSVTFAPGETKKTIVVLVNGDTLVESNETFFVKLSNPVNAVVTDASGRGTILNDDASAPILASSLGEAGLIATPAEEERATDHREEPIAKRLERFDLALADLVLTSPDFIALSEPDSEAVGLFPSRRRKL